MMLQHLAKDGNNDVKTCKVCGHAKYISESLPKEPRYESHQVATIGGREFNICYGGCLYEPLAPNYHKYVEKDMVT